MIIHSSWKSHNSIPMSLSAFQFSWKIVYWCIVSTPVLCSVSFVPSLRRLKFILVHKLISSLKVCASIIIITMTLLYDNFVFQRLEHSTLKIYIIIFVSSRCTPNATGRYRGAKIVYSIDPDLATSYLPTSYLSTEFIQPQTPLSIICLFLPSIIMSVASSTYLLGQNNVQAKVSSLMYFLRLG